MPVRLQTTDLSGKLKGNHAGLAFTLMRTPRTFAVALLAPVILSGCAPENAANLSAEVNQQAVAAKTKEYFHLRPEVERAFGYSHALRIGSDVKISGAVSMNDAGQPTAAKDIEQQMKNIYADLEMILRHYDLTFDDVIVENVFTTDMDAFLQVAAYRNSIYTGQFPTGSWLEVKGLALPEFMLEIEIEAYSPE